MKIILILTFILLASNAQKVPGVKVAVHPDILTATKDAYIPEVVNQILTTPIADMKQNGMELKNIKVKSIDLKAENIYISFQNDHIQVDAYDFDMVLTMSASKQVFLFSFTAGLTASCSNSSFSAHIVTELGDNKIKFKVKEVDVNIRNEKLVSDNWLADSEVKKLVQSGQFKKLLAKTLEDQLKAKLATTLNDLSSQAPTNSPIPSSPFSVDYTIVKNLNIRPGQLTASLDGTVYLTETGYSPALVAEIELPDNDPESEQKVQIFISNYVFNTALYELWKQDFFSIHLTPEDLPDSDSLPISLDTTSFSMLFPGLDEKYDDAPINLYCYDKDDTAPTVEINGEKVIAVATTACDIDVWDANVTNWVKAFTFHSKLTVVSFLSVNPETNELAISIETATISDTEFTDATVENIETGMIEAQLNIALDVFTPFTYNFPLPQIPLTTLENAEIKLFNGYVEIGANGKRSNLTEYVPYENSKTTETLLGGGSP